MIWARRMTLMRKKTRSKINNNLFSLNQKSVQVLRPSLKVTLSFARSRFLKLLWIGTSTITHLRQPKHSAQHSLHHHISHRKAPLQTSENSRSSTLSRSNSYHKHKHNGASRLKSTRKRPPPPILRPPRSQPKRHTRHSTTTPRSKQLPRPRSSLFPRRWPRRHQHLPQNLRPRYQTHPVTLAHSLLPQQQQLCATTLTPARTSWYKCTE